MEQASITMELGEKIDISAISTLKATLDSLPINTEPQLFDARYVTHIDSASCQLFYAYAQHLARHNTTLMFLSPSDKFMTVVTALGFETDFNYASM
ncbi:STAS domain-containing protein [Moritella marina ATCC 15381]|uniref:STAS domain-containing protein n=1 Tax=Moritella marina ATCC 15381 TaxID=1202962 RepID=A0A5J6WPZ4_MORMI|nr:STAS domain-containing protein [Moritella marina]QFI39391.1 STAS domain-containing protein [Moritella marina ATCC 15381]